MATAVEALDETNAAAEAPAGSPPAHWRPIPPPTAPTAIPLRESTTSCLLDCVHCGLCTASCPTYVETGNENDSPRGRIYLMRAVRDERLELSHEVRRHLELCLDCRACETACPSGVQYGKLIEPFRVAMEQTRRRSASSENRRLVSPLDFVRPVSLSRQAPPIARVRRGSLKRSGSIA